jgi:hypothetical protein
MNMDATAEVPVSKHLVGKHTVIEVLLKILIFSSVRAQWFYRESSVEKPCLEASSNTSTVTLRVVGGDEKGTQCLGV